MNLPFRRVHLYTLFVGFLSFAILYLFRGQLTEHFVNVVNPSPLWFWMEGWQHTEFVTGLIGLLTGFNMFFFRRMYGWRHKSKETPKEFEGALDEIQGLRKEVTQLQDNLHITDENLFTFFKYLNPVLKPAGIMFEWTSEGRIFLQEAKSKIEQKNKIVQHHQDKIDQMEEVEIDT